jgi:hypothetical protein
LHPNGNIAEFLLAAGLARIIDWHAGMLAANGNMERLRAAEKYVILLVVWHALQVLKVHVGLQKKRS